MILRTLEVLRFGSLVDRRFELGPGVWIFEGPNEAGKTSLQRAARALLYGFAARSSARHDLGAAGETLGVAGTLETQNGLLRVERALAAHATVRTGEGAQARRGNDPLAGLLPGTRAAFEQLHCLSPDDQRAFGADPGPELDRLLTGALLEGSSAREIAHQIDGERTALWRADRRSKRTRAVEIDAELAALGEESRAARALEAELAELESRTVELEKRVERIEADALRSEAKIEALRVLERMARAVREGGDLDPGPEAPEEPGPLLAALEEAEEQALPPRERLARNAVRLAPQDPAVLERAGEIEAVSRGAAERARLMARLDDARSEAESHRAEARTLIRSATGQDSLSLDLDGLLGLEAAIAVDGEGAAWKALPSIRSAMLGYGIAAAGVCSAALSGHWMPAAVGAFLAPLPLALVRPRVVASDGDPRRIRAAAERMGIDERWLGTREGCAAAAERLRRGAEALARSAARSAAADEARGNAREQLAGWADLCSSLDVELESAEAAPEVLARALSDARERQVLWTRDQAEREAAELELERAEARAREASLRFERTAELLRSTIPGARSVDDAYGRWQQAAAARERSRGVLEELMGEPALEGLAADDGLIRAARTGRFDESELRAEEAHAASLRAELSACGDELVRASERLRRERPARTASELDSAKLELGAERDDVLRRHDELALASALLREGERRHRASHQSGILGRASRLLSAVTGGRHSGLEYGELNGASGLTVVDAERGMRVPVAAPLSRGAREQVHLCLRLAAVAEHEAEGASAPLLLDEAFAHWDAERRGAAAAALADFSREHSVQVLLFTCHAFLGEELAQATGGRRVSI